MGKLEEALRSEIRRLARKEVRAACDPLAKQVRELRRQVAQLKKTVSAGPAPAAAKTAPAVHRRTSKPASARIASAGEKRPSTATRRIR